MNAWKTGDGQRAAQAMDAPDWLINGNDLDWPISVCVLRDRAIHHLLGHGIILDAEPMPDGSVVWLAESTTASGLVMDVEDADQDALLVRAILAVAKGGAK